MYTTRNKLKATDKEPSDMYGVNVNDMHFAMVNAIKQLTEKNEGLAEKDWELIEHTVLLREEIRLLKSRMNALDQTIKLSAA